MSAIVLDNIYKHYQLYANDYQRLLEIISGRSKAKVIKALDPVSLTINKGQVVGIIGNNGAGKSTLLKLICGTANPSGGQMQVNGRIAALLELGSGFHPELTGHENIYLSAAILGISRAQIENVYDDIIEFSGIGDFIQQPVKTYSSGMFVRLAFALATSVDPDILVIDEALSVGDGHFAKKSFDRIIKFKEADKTILFCSHSMFHIESICDRAIWIDEGQIKMDGPPASVIPVYNATMKVHHNSLKHNSSLEQVNSLEHVNSLAPAHEQEQQNEAAQVNNTGNEAKLSHFIALSMSIDGQGEPVAIAQSGLSTLCVQARFSSDVAIKPPTFALTITDENGFNVASVCTLIDQYPIERDEHGLSNIELSFPTIKLLKGKYFVFAYLMCEQCIFIYDEAPQFARFEVRQQTQELGIVSLEHQWHSG